MNKKSFENRQLEPTIDTFKICIKCNIYNEILHLYNCRDDKKLNFFIINNCIKVKLCMNKKVFFTHITMYGIKSHNVKKDIIKKSLIDRLIIYLIENIPLSKVYIKQLDIAFDYKMEPEKIFIYKRYTNKQNKYIKLYELDSDKSYKDYSLYLHNFKYYKANIYKLIKEVNDINSFGIPLFEEIKKDLNNEFEKYYNSNYKEKCKKRMFTKYIKNKYYELDTEFIKKENNNYYLYIPRNLYESLSYKSIINSYKDNKIYFKPDTRTSHVIKYDKANKVFIKERINLEEALTRIEFIVNFDNLLITDIDKIINNIIKQFNTIYITDYIINKKTLNSFEKVYSNDNLFDDCIKEKSENIILTFLSKFK